MNYVIEQIANKGRYGDDKLVHMSSGEINGLKALAKATGTQITKNPETGLDEAFNLRTILPIVAGAALGPAGIGLTAMQAGLLTGAAATAITGDPMQGLSAGFGGYGGAGLAGGLSAAGAAPSTGTAPVTEAMTTDAGISQGATQSVMPAAGGGTQAYSSNLNVIDPSRGAEYMAGAPGTQPAVPIRTSVPTEPISSAYFDPQGSTMQAPISEVKGIGAGRPAGQLTVDKATSGIKDFFAPATEKAQTMGAGLRDVVADAPGARDRFMEAVGGKSGLTKSALAASAPVLSEAMEPPETTSYSDSFSRDYETYLDRLGLMRTRPKFAEGGSTTEASLTNASGLGSLIKGNGDGMADEILAKVSPGEYIITAQAVSALGNGNTDAGAKKLDGMMDRIYQMQTGEPEQMREIDASKVLIA